MAPSTLRKSAVVRRGMLAAARVGVSGNVGLEYLLTRTAVKEIAVTIVATFAATSIFLGDVFHDEITSSD